ncbi:hypothetical protein SAMN05421788_10423 [Filimonas lacunae]|uniref:LTXXQ motif family protein n=1 Tax=Filimonas lacunae TaxID=477680 RepID=A0A173M9U7_9BACT|nr:hypothetical protein [Filimonas lacunae]BAV04248.1 hypothetical protein FLA_0227 [Filimonas lacunae]SIT13597.1 hypothetical protein SAMN05421788_10423 [Filimonas lacunae]
MKRAIQATVLCVVLLFSVAVIARQSPEDFKNTTPEQRAQVQTNLMKSKLQLTDDQTTKVAAINLKYAKQMEPVIKGDGGKMAKFKQAKKINESKEAELKTVFTEEQFASYEKGKEEMKQEVMKKIKEKRQ